MEQKKNSVSKVDLNFTFWRQAHRCGIPCRGDKRRSFRTRLCGHDEAGRRRVDGHVARHEPDVSELLEQLAVLLVAQRLDRRRVDDALLVTQGHRDRVSEQEKGIVAFSQKLRLTTRDFGAESCRFTTELSFVAQLYIV